MKLQDRCLRTLSAFPGRLLPGLLLLATVGGCATVPQKPSEDDSGIPGGVFISRQQIAESGARDGLEALERARTHLMIQRTRAGSPPRILHRGVDSISNDGWILVVVDDAPSTADPGTTLQQIDADHIAFMKVLTAREATPRYGVMAGNGVIFVRTTAYGAPSR